MTGRNELCPCGSGRKYKRCCAVHRTTNYVRDDEQIEYELPDPWGLLLAIGRGEMDPEAARIAAAMLAHALESLGVAQPEGEDAVEAVLEAAALAARADAEGIPPEVVMQILGGGDMMPT